MKLIVAKVKTKMTSEHLAMINTLPEVCNLVLGQILIALKPVLI